MRGTPRRWTEGEVDALKNLAASGHTYYQIAQQLHRQPSSVAAKCRQLGVETVMSGWWAKQKALKTIGLKRCSMCGVDLPISEFHNKTLKGGKGCWCRACLNKYNGERISKDVATLLAERLRTAREHVKSRVTQAVVTITLQDLLLLWEKQGGRCYYTGVEMSTEYRAGKRAGSKRISIDRIDPDAGYIPGNVVLCCDTVNMMKNSMSILEFTQWCGLVVGHQRT